MIKLWMSCEIDLDVLDEYVEIERNLERIINERLNNITISMQYEKWAVIPIIKHIDSPQFGEVNKQNRKSKVLEFRLKIDHSRFKAADPAEKRNLVLDLLNRSVDLMEQFGVSVSDRTNLQSVLTDVRNS